MAKKKPIPQRRRKEDKQRRVLGVVANAKNIIIAVALLFGFIAGFFQVFNWMECTYAKKAEHERVEALNDYRWETTILNGMYSRFCSLEPIIKIAVNPKSIPAETMKEYSELRAKIPVQEALVKSLEAKSRK